jgi:hypothetical protein
LATTIPGHLPDSAPLSFRTKKWIWARWRSRYVQKPTHHYAHCRLMALPQVSQFEPPAEPHGGRGRLPRVHDRPPLRPEPDRRSLAASPLKDALQEAWLMTESLQTSDGRPLSLRDKTD